jgi:hypothetical protein
MTPPGGTQDRLCANTPTNADPFVAAATAFLGMFGITPNIDQDGRIKVIFGEP